MSRDRKSGVLGAKNLCVEMSLEVIIIMKVSRTEEDVLKKILSRAVGGRSGELPCARDKDTDSPLFKPLLGAMHRILVISYMLQLKAGPEPLKFHDKQSKPGKEY
jgi:hypothetical protein